MGGELVPMFINGKRSHGNNKSRFAVLNPATGEPVRELATADAADLDNAIETASRAFGHWRMTEPQQRSAVLKKAAQLLRDRIDIIAPLITEEEGKPIGEARGEVEDGADCLEFLGEEARRVYGRVLTRAPGTRALVTYEPVGPVAAFAPWNYPVSNACRKLGAAIAAGCSIILKPAEEAPSSVLAVLECLLDAGLPEDIAQIVFGDPDMVSRHLLASSVIRKVSFTGSVPVGKHLVKLASDTMKRTTMELGGHAPVILFDDCDLEAALNIMARAKYRNAGQICVSPTRFYVAKPIYDDFVQGFADRVRRIIVGPGADPATIMGPLANARRIDAMTRLVSDAVSKGARLVSGGNRIGDKGFFWEPTILTNVPDQAYINNEEPFGPVALIAPFDSFEEAVHQANRLPYGLAAYAFTRDNRQVMKIGAALEAGVIAINCNSIGDADAPFGGVKESGHGAEQGPEGLAAYLVTKSIVEV
jgi:succinate-semialdehyde dehydrogenase/glutarate-semialdehyde dehydrogenase